MNLVSIITPAYNVAAFIGETIRSVQQQSFQNWELLVVDDGSVDETAEIVKTFALGDHRIILVQQQNGGPAIARQTAIDRARGRYIAFLDSDDLWLPDKLAHQLEFMCQRNAAISYTQYRRIDVSGTRTGRVISIPERLNYQQLLGNTAIATSTAMVDRDMTGPLQMKQTYYDDYALWLDLLRKGHVAHGLREDLVRYRVRNHSVSRNKLRSAQMVWKTYRDIEGLPITLAAWAFCRYAMRAYLKYSRY